LLLPFHIHSINRKPHFSARVAEWLLGVVNFDSWHSRITVEAIGIRNEWPKIFLDWLSDRRTNGNGTHGRALMKDELAAGVFSETHRQICPQDR
jgi:hypothetical protein